MRSEDQKARNTTEQAGVMRSSDGIEGFIYALKRMDRVKLHGSSAGLPGVVSQPR